jgi:amino acid adenylation domain-containing protein
MTAMTSNAREAQIAWNATARHYPADETVHGLFERQARLAPSRVAIRAADGETLTYRELAGRSNAFARYLIGLGVKRGSLVGMCIDHSPELFTALLGILKAGAAYVPLDPMLPPARLEWILADTAAEVIVTTQALSVAIPASFADRVICIDATGPDAVRQPRDDPVSGAGPEDLLYVMYTSGSTGRPKGVLVPHRGVVNYLWWAIDGYGLEGERGAPLVGSIAFDLSVPNFWLPLIGGKCVTLLPPDRALENLARLLERSLDFSLLKITPAHLDVLRTILKPGAVTSVRTLVVGADEVRPETVAGWLQVAPGMRIINEYGPTETVVGCSVFTIPDPFDPSAPVPIGKPIGNLRMYVLDERLDPLPAGGIGELYIGGDGVARGYLNQPALTAVRFLPDPFGPPGSRLYRSGDLARIRPDGNFDFLGRSDSQVKIRGYRVELGEVEARLGMYPGITEAVAGAYTDKFGNRCLAAYLVTDAGTAPPSESELRTFMAEVLPAAMVPSVFITLDAMPLTPAGKIDHTALPVSSSASR